MGPGDVKRVHSQLEKHGVFFSALDTVAGMRVLAQFWFFEGRLYRIALRAAPGGPLKSAADSERQRESEREWFEEVKTLLVENYGAPRERSNGTDTTLLWRKGTTGIALAIDRTGARIDYGDLERIDAGDGATDAAMQRALDAEKNAERERL
jgi:hypothetical protein